MALPPRAVTVLSLLQFFFIGMGYLITRRFVHIGGGPLPTPFRSLPGFIATFGFWFFLLPAIWGVIATARTRISDELAGPSTTNVLLGAAMTASLGLVFGISSFQAIRGAIVGCGAF